MNSTHRKHWEPIANQMQKDGWNCDYSKALDASVGNQWVVDARKGDGPRYVVYAETLVEGFEKLQTAIQRVNLGMRNAKTGCKTGIHQDTLMVD